MPTSPSVDPRYTAHTQYRQFVDFALGAKEDAIAESRGNLIVGAKSKLDFVGNVLRTSSSKASNDAVRSRFKAAIMGMFCVTDESALPDSVREAMKLDDYGKGKPLTARRILAVQTTVDKYFADKAQNLMAEAVRQGVEDNATTQKLVRAAVRACVEDPEAMEVVKANIKDILVDFSIPGGRDVMRPVHGVKERVDAVTANFRALRAFGKDDADLFTVGKGYVNLTERDFTALMSAAMEGRQRLQPHLDQVLKHSRGAKDMDEGVREFSKIFEETMAKCTAVVGQPAEPAEAARLQTFVARMLFHRDGDSRSVYHELDVAVKSDTAKQLKTLYRDLMADFRTAPDGQGPFGKLSGGLRLYMADHAERGSKFLEFLNNAMYDVYGVPANERRPVGTLQGNTRTSSEFNSVGQSLKTAGLKTMREEREAFLNGAVKGSGDAADRMRSVFARKADEAALYKPADTLKRQCEETIRRMLNQSFSLGMREARAPNVTMAKFGSLVEPVPVKLPGGTTLSHDAHWARDELADFITKGEKTAFKDLTPAEQRKVYAIMAIVSQDIAATSYEGPERVLDPKYDPQKGPLEEASHKRQFRFYEDPKDRGNPAVTLALGDDGGLRIGFKDIRYVTEVGTLTDDGRGYVDTHVKGMEDIAVFSPADVLMGRTLGSSIGVEYSLQIKGDAFTRLTDSDLGQAQLGESDMVCSDFRMTMALYDPSAW